MAIVDGSLQLGYKDSAWFTANATLVLLAGQVVYLQQTGTYKLGDGVTQLSALSFLGASSGDMLKSVYDIDNTGVVDNAEAIKIIGRNSTGATLRKGTIIYLNGSTGNRPNFVKAQANSEATSAGTFGVIADDLANNTDGYALCLGYLDNLDTRTTATYPFTTDTLVDGDTIYLSPTTAGYITNVKPSAPNHLVYLGKVTRTSPTNGTIVYRVQNGYELDELHDVQDVSYSSPIDADSLLIKDSTNSLWKRLTFANLKTYLTGLYVGLTGNQTVAGQKTFTDDTNIGNAATTGQRKLRVGQDTAWIDLGSATDGSGNSFISFGQTTNTLANSALSGGQFSTALNSNNQVLLRISNSTKATLTTSSLTIATGVNLNIANETASRVLYLDASKNVKSSSVTDTTLGYLDATSSIQTQLNGKLSTTITSVAKGDTVEYNGSAWVNVGIQYTVELIDALTIDIYAPYGMKINSVTNILNSPTTTILVGGSAYTLGNTITTGQKITVTVSVAAVVTLNINKV